MTLRLRALLAGAVLVLAGCSTPVAEPSLPEGKSPEQQELSFSDCGQGFECATIATPLNWLAQDGEFLNIKLMRAIGTEYLEPILVNPGGPGSSAIAWMRNNYQSIGSSWLRDNYQVIAFDPRGVGESTSVQCSDTALKDELLYGISDFEFGSAEDIAYSESVMADFAASCQEQGPDLGYFNTQQTARDMDLIRGLLGVAELNYLGFSYGSELGATYIALFPDKVGKFVLDGAVDPTIDEETKLLGQVRGFDQALRAYLEDCFQQAYCPFAGDVDSAMRQISGFMQAREAVPLPTQEDRELGVSALLAGIIVTLYSEDSWVYLSQAFDEAFAGDGTTFLFLADFYNDRDPSGGYLSNINEANYAINCADSTRKPEAADLSAEITEASLVFGKYFAYPIDSCAGWPDGIGLVDLQYSQELANKPIIVGTTGDPATPYSQAVSLAALLGGKLLTLEGEGHTAYGQNSCINSLVDAYLAGEDLGEGNLTCF